MEDDDDDDDDDEEDDGVGGAGGKRSRDHDKKGKTLGKQRRKIRKIMDDDKLGQSTKGVCVFCVCVCVCVCVSLSLSGTLCMYVFIDSRHE